MEVLIAWSKPKYGRNGWFPIYTNVLNTPESIVRDDLYSFGNFRDFPHKNSINDIVYDL